MCIGHGKDLCVISKKNEGREGWLIGPGAIFLISSERCLFARNETYFSVAFLSYILGKIKKTKKKKKVPLIQLCYIFFKNYVPVEKNLREFS